LIKAIIKRVQLSDQRGGLSILTALGFILFSVPLITGSLNLAQNTAIDSRVKAGIFNEQYCILSTEEYLDYLVLDSGRWSAWLTDNKDLVLDPLGFTSVETFTPCDEDITITVVSQPDVPPESLIDPLGDPQSYVPSINPFSDWLFQTLLAVDNANPTGGDTVVYTITVINQSDTATELEEIKTDIPPEFTYDCNATTAQITLPNAAPVGLNPELFSSDLCNGTPDSSDDNINWVMSNLANGDPTIEPDEVVTLTFTVITSLVPGTYCAEAKVKPIESMARSGPTANVQIGGVAGFCSDDPITVVLTLDSADLVSTNTSVYPFVYTFDVDFTITVTNPGANMIEIHEIENLLPVGFSQLLIDFSGDITDGLVSGTPTWESSVGRYYYQWDFDTSGNRPTVDSGTSKTIKYSTEAIISSGIYWTDLVVDIHPSDPKDTYTYPTALLYVKDAYDVTITDESGEELPVAVEVWIGNQNGVINRWSQ